MKTAPLSALLLLINSAAHAGPRSSADYSITTDSTDCGGTRTTSAAYAVDSSTGGVAGLSTAASPTASAKHGYIGQLYEITALQLAATPATINEGGTRQLSGAQCLDDGTILAVPAGSITWSVQSGPLTGINASGLATAGPVYQDTAATVRGDYAGLTGLLGLTVLDTVADNFGMYAGDGLGDDWQFQHFGLDNPNAAPGVDFDHDGQDNEFEFIAGLVPTDAASSFTHRIESVPGQPGQKNIIFGPVFGGRSYSILTNTTLNPANWLPLSTGSPPNDNGNERTITDTAATGAAKFYQVLIVRP